jgi:hypothetical protein
MLVLGLTVPYADDTDLFYRLIHTLFGHPQATSRRPDGFDYYYTLDVFNPFEQLGNGRH